MPRRVPRPPTGPGWIFELKFDGFRALAGRRGRKAFLLSRKGTNLLRSFPELEAPLLELPELTLDGELVLLDVEGRPRFDQLSKRFAFGRADAVAIASKEAPAAIFAFDLLMLGKRDLRGLPLLERKAALRRALKGSRRIRPTTIVRGNGEAFFRQVEAMELEGIVGKRIDSVYTRGPACGWVKVKTAAGRKVDEDRAAWNR